MDESSHQQVIRLFGSSVVDDRGNNILLLPPVSSHSKLNCTTIQNNINAYATVYLDRPFLPTHMSGWTPIERRDQSHNRNRAVYYNTLQQNMSGSVQCAESTDLMVSLNVKAVQAIVDILSTMTDSTRNVYVFPRMDGEYSLFMDGRFESEHVNPALALASEAIKKLHKRDVSGHTRLTVDADRNPHVDRSGIDAWLIGEDAMNVRRRAQKDIEDVLSLSDLAGIVATFWFSEVEMLVNCPLPFIFFLGAGV